MGQIKTVITKYSFIRPPQISEESFYNIKQMLKNNPNYDITPKSSFWDEFEGLKWLLIALILGFPFGLIWEPIFFIIIFIAIFTLISIFTSGVIQSLWSYQTFLNDKNRYYENLKNTISTSNSYSEFLNNHF